MLDGTLAAGAAAAPEPRKSSDANIQDDRPRTARLWRRSDGRFASPLRPLHRRRRRRAGRRGHLPTDNPYTGQTWATIARGTAADVEAAVAAADRAFNDGAWPALTPSERGRLLWKLGELVQANAEKLALIEQRDNGKLFAEGSPRRSTWRSGTSLLRRAWPTRSRARSSRPTSRTRSTTRATNRSAWSAIITPWNSPLLLTAGSSRRRWPRAARSSSSRRSSRRPRRSSSSKLVERGRLPAGRGQRRHRLRRRSRRAAGRASAGRESRLHAARRRDRPQIYELAARGFKRVTLELGGKSPNIVFDDADIDNAVKGAVSGIFAATGQTCIAGSRLLVQASIHDHFVEKLVASRRPRRWAIR